MAGGWGRGHKTEWYAMGKGNSDAKARGRLQEAMTATVGPATPDRRLGYTLVELGDGTAWMSEGAPPHYCCPKCLDRFGDLSIMSVARGTGRSTSLQCKACNYRVQRSTES